MLLGKLIQFPIEDSSSNLFIEGNLVIPEDPIGIVIFAHGSGSSKSSIRNEFVSEKLNKNKIATVLFDLLYKEEREYDTKVENMEVKAPGVILNKFNIKLLTKRLSMVTEWVEHNPSTEKLPIGYFASSTGAAAALISASKYDITSIVIRSGRTDLVETRFLDKILSPCMFVVGSKEKFMVMVSNETMRKMKNSKDKKLNIIKNASHLFEEPGAMAEVSEIATHWMAGNFNLVTSNTRHEK